MTSFAYENNDHSLQVLDAVKKMQAAGAQISDIELAKIEVLSDIGFTYPAHFIQLTDQMGIPLFDLITDGDKDGLIVLAPAGETGDCLVPSTFNPEVCAFDDNAQSLPNIRCRNFDICNVVAPGYGLTDSVLS
ncbi:hypothetical protein A3J78_01530 [Candidatus Beckwithbacteria bacterium RBG_13_35_6]|uniref:Uncharacterized protein n=1 Tax=Candidatus Beckwithbacteria bacterium RBG_13_35_6 TaxID=1797456 RepID=A0A1F5DI15_9BACT|nr:MAG: hypothetical protein A3J78_01530 [Candidatus Beckwithbacteria bacterium RBG_13_35_6]